MAIQADVTIAQTAGGDTSAYPYMLAPGSAAMQDITPVSVRRSDGDTRFQTLQTEGFYSQSNWQAGFGVRNQLDPNAYWVGTADTSYTGQAVCAQALQSAVVATRHPVLFIEHGTDLYGLFVSDAAPSYVLYKRTGTGAGTWTATGYTTASEPTSAVSYRGSLYFAFGSTGSFVERTDGVAAGTAMTFKAHLLEAYSSMLHYLFWDTTGTPTWRLARYDPDNVDTLNVAAFAFPAPLPWTPRAMRAAYGALYITWSDSLWQYTSQNGNSGTLIGPLDRWAITYYSGNALEAHEGALVYNAGPILRRYPPGGSPRTLFPTPPREATNATGWGEPVALRSVSGRLYVLTLEQQQFVGGALPLNSTTNKVRIHAWTDTGMHRVAWQDQSYTSSLYLTRPTLAYDRQTSLFVGINESNADYSSGYTCARVIIPILTGSVPQDAGLLYAGLAPVYQTSTIETGRLEFGLADVLKSLRRVRYRAGSGGTIGIEYTTDDTNWTTLTAVTTYTPAGQYDQGFSELAVPSNGTATARWFRFRITLTPGGGGTTTPILTAVAAIPNPALPLRNGFKLSIPIGRNVEDYNGNVMYPNDAAVTAALARVKAFRATGDNLDPATNAPLALTWVDGITYTVRANTRVIARQRTSKNAGKYWVLTFDLQEIT